MIGQSSISMNMDALSAKAKSDYNQVRLEAQLKRILAILAGKPTELLSFDAIKKTMQLSNPINRKAQPVRLDQIIGSLDRYQEFDREFRPLNGYTAERWQSINRAHYLGISLPLVILYKIDEIYFVVDGHHRISVARKHGQVFIDAEILEFNPGKNNSTNTVPKDVDLKMRFTEN